MSICDPTPKQWSMCLVKYRKPCFPAEPGQAEFCFKEVKVTNEILTGKVYDRNDNFVADLSGTCLPFVGRSNVSRMSFFFLVANNKGVPLEILLTGWGYQPATPNPLFFGGFVVLKPLSANPAPPGLPGAPVSFDEGDTGTGTGQQAACEFPDS